MATAIAQEIQTGDLPIGGFYNRSTMYRVWIWYKNKSAGTGVTFTISTSTDGGTNWTAAPTITVADTETTDLQHVKADINHNGYLMRVKVAWSTVSTGGSVEIEALTLEYEKINIEE